MTRRLAALLPLPLALIASAIGGACGGTPSGAPRARHVVVVVLDATHATHLGCYGGPPQTTPNLDALAARAARFAHAFSSTTWTLPSTVSLMTGLIPERHGVVTPAHRPGDNLVLMSERFGAAGYRTTALVQMPFASGEFGLDRGFDEPAYYGPRDDEARLELHRRMMRWVEELGERPELLYVHLRRPHTPYDPPRLDLLPFEQGCGLADEIPGVSHIIDPLLVDEREREHIRHLYRANLRHVDGRLAPFLDALGPRLEHDTVLVVTSDHGEGLGEHGLFGHGRPLYAEHVHVPLIVAGPGIGPVVVDEAVSTVDVLPTLLDLVGLAPRAPGRAPLDGRSLVPLMRGADEPGRTVVTTSRRREGEPVRAAAVRDGLKLTIDLDGTATLHDLRVPLEAREDLSDVRPGLVEVLSGRLAPLRAWEPASWGDDGEPVDEALRDDLVELGYAR